MIGYVGRVLHLFFPFRSIVNFCRCLFGGLKSCICYIRINGIRANNVIRMIVIKLKGPVFFFLSILTLRLIPDELGGPVATASAL